MPSLTAREAKVLSMPKTASAMGEDLVRTSWLVSLPASPLLRILAVHPVCAVNVANSGSGTTKLSWVATRTVPPAGHGFAAAVAAPVPLWVPVLVELAGIAGVGAPPPSEHPGS